MTRAFSPLLSWSYLSLYLFRVFRLAALLAAVLVTSCGGGDTVDLQNYVAQVKSQEKGRIEPLPQFKPFKTFAYNAVLEKDPFAAWVTERIPEQILLKMVLCSSLCEHVVSVLTLTDVKSCSSNTRLTR